MKGNSWASWGVASPLRWRGGVFLKVSEPATEKKLLLHKDLVLRERGCNQVKLRETCKTSRVVGFSNDGVAVGETCDRRMEREGARKRASE